MSVVGLNIKRLRLERGLSQAALAEQAKVAQSLIGGLEGESIQTTKKLPRIAKALGVRPEEIDPDYAVESGMRSIPGPNASTPLVPYWVSANEDLPLYSVVETELGLFVRKQRPAFMLARIHTLRFSEEAYALIIAASVMEPEFFAGDIAYINPDLPPIQNTTCVFYEDDELTRHIVARLDKVADSHWITTTWNVRGKRQSQPLDRKQWPICHRVVAKLYRD